MKKNTEDQNANCMTWDGFNAERVHVVFLIKAGFLVYSLKR